MDKMSLWQACTVLCALCLLTLAGSPSKAQGSEPAPHCPAHISQLSLPGQADTWTQLDQGRCDDHELATSTIPLEAGARSATLLFRDFGLQIPPTARITGIEVVLIRRSNVPNGIVDARIALLKGNQQVDSSPHNPEPWEDQWMAAFYGGSQQQWGTVWKPTDLNQPEFGVAVEVKGQTTGARAEIDEVNVTVHYTLPAGVARSVSLSNTHCQANFFKP